MRPPPVVTTGDLRRRERWALGIAVGAVVFVASYTGQRLFSAALGEPTPTEVIATTHTPYYWRVGLATLQALVAVPLGALLPPEPVVRPLLRIGPLWVVASVMIHALLVVVFP